MGKYENKGCCCHSRVGGNLIGFCKNNQTKPNIHYDIGGMRRAVSLR
jgi:hypothetical protein